MTQSDQILETFTLVSCSRCAADTFPDPDVAQTLCGECWADDQEHELAKSIQQGPRFVTTMELFHAVESLSWEYHTEDEMDGTYVVAEHIDGRTGISRSIQFLDDPEWAPNQFTSEFVIALCDEARSDAIIDNYRGNR